MDRVTNLVSRDKLIEWERFATEQQTKSNDDIFPSVRLFGLLLSLLIFGIALLVNLIIPDDKIASRCMALLLFVVSLWITEVIPSSHTPPALPPTPSPPLRLLAGHPLLRHRLAYPASRRNSRRAEGSQRPHEVHVGGSGCFIHSQPHIQPHHHVATRRIHHLHGLLPVI